jgi:acetolactate synthase-1/2/3 large subunit
MKGVNKKAWEKEDISRRVNKWYCEAVKKPQKENEPLKPQVIMDIVNHFITDGDMAVCDASLASGWAAVYYRVKKPGRHFLAPRGLAGLGWGAPACGVALATSNTGYLFTGDGGFAILFKN